MGTGLNGSSTRHTVPKAETLSSGGTGLGIEGAAVDIACTDPSNASCNQRMVVADMDNGNTARGRMGPAAAEAHRQIIRSKYVDRSRHPRGPFVRTSPKEMHKFAATRQADEPPPPQIMNTYT